MPSFIWDAIASTYRDLQGGSTPGGPGTDPEPTEAPQFGSVPVGAASYAVPTSNVIWVATTGNDTSGTGSNNTPYKTIKRALAVAPAGSTVVVRGGVYEEGGWTGDLASAPSVANDNITLQNAPGEAVWLDGSTPATGWTADTTAVPGKTIWRAPFVLTATRTPTQNPNYSDPDAVNYASFLVKESPIAHWNEMCLYDGVQLKQVATLAEVGPGTFYVEGAGYAKKFHAITHEELASNYNFTSTHYVIGDNPNGHEVRISRYSRALNFSKSGLTLRGIGVRRYASCLADSGTVYCGSSTMNNLTVENVVIEDISAGPGMQIGTNDSIVRRCTVRRCGLMGFGISGDRATVERCRFTENNYRLFNYGPYGGSIKTGRIEDPTIRYNWFESTKGHALWFDECSIRATVHGNLFTNNWGVGIIFEISDRIIIADNIIIDNGINSPVGGDRRPWNCPAILISGSNRARIWHNTIINPSVAIKVTQDWRQPTGDPASFGRDPRRASSWYAQNCSWNVTEFESCNNALIGCNGNTEVESTFYRTSGQTAPPSGSTAAVKPALPLSTGFVAGGNLYNRTAANRPTRFALTYVGPDVKIHTSMENTGTGDYDPPVAWRTLLTENGSRLVTSAGPWSNAETLRIGTHAVAPAAVPSDVAALLAASPWTGQQSVGAGYTVLPQ